MKRGLNKVIKRYYEYFERTILQIRTMEIGIFVLYLSFVVIPVSILIGYDPAFGSHNHFVSGHLYEKPSFDSSIIVALSKDEISIVKRDNGWCLALMKDGRSGWISEKILGSADSFDGDGRFLLVRVSSGKVREKPSFSADVHFGVSRGEQVDLLTTEGKWCFIRKQDGKIGWAHESIFEKTFDIEKNSSSKNMGNNQKILRIDIKKEYPNNEYVRFTLASDFLPKTFPLEDDIPKIVCDFKNTVVCDDLKRIINVNGNLIDKIRLGEHKDKENTMIRVVVDLIPNRFYDVEQIYFQEEKIYQLALRYVTK